MVEHKRALLIGINYEKSRYELHGCINDAKNIKELLMTHYGFSADNILLLSDEEHFKPTRSNITEGFKWLLSKTPASRFKSEKYLPLSADDKCSLVFHYSGHGSQVKDTNGDEKDGYDETICPIDFDKAGMITDDEIRESLAMKVPKGSKLFAVVDACHSGSSFDLMWNMKSSFPGRFTLDVENSYKPTTANVIMFSGCRDDQTSADVNIGGQGQGALTNSILNVLKKCEYKISYDKLLVDVRKYIVDNKLSDQIPCMSFGKYTNITADFVL